MQGDLDRYTFRSELESQEFAKYLLSRGIPFTFHGRLESTETPGLMLCKYSLRWEDCMSVGFPTNCVKHAFKYFNRTSYNYGDTFRETLFEKMWKACSNRPSFSSEQ